jgi:hypothetical protein
MAKMTEIYCTARLGRKNVEDGMPCLCHNGANAVQRSTI